VLPEVYSSEVVKAMKQRMAEIVEDIDIRVKFIFLLLHLEDNFRLLFLFGNFFPLQQDVLVSCQFFPNEIDMET
jgi:hypothetical protein